MSHLPKRKLSSFGPRRQTGAIGDLAWSFRNYIATDLAIIKNTEIRHWENGVFTGPREDDVRSQFSRT